MWDEEKFEDCGHYYSCHYDNVRGEVIVCPHYNWGRCDLHDEYPQVFPEECICEEDES